MTATKRPAPPQNRPSPNHINAYESNAHVLNTDQARKLESRMVAWWPVHEFVAAAVAQVDSLPAAGTPAWCALADDDPAKLLALAVAGEHHVLRMEIAQEVRAAASKAVAAAADWPAIAREVGALADARRTGVRIERRAER